MYDSNEVIDDLLEIATPSRVEMPVSGKRSKRIDEYDDKIKPRSSKKWGTGVTFRGERNRNPVHLEQGRLEADRIREGMRMIHASEGDE